MFRRQLQAKIENSLQSFPAVALLGPRQSGKTTLAKTIATKGQNYVYLDLERPSDLGKLTDPELYLSALSDKLVILDEVQRQRELFPLLRSLIDDKRRPGRFLLLGSASPDLLRQSSESLAGRIEYLELTPLLLNELKNPEKAWRTHWLRGGFPESFLARTLTTSHNWRNAFIQTHLERDIPSLGIRIPATALRRFWLMIANSHGQIWNASRIATSLQISAPTVNHYLDILEDTFMVRRLEPFFSNIKKRLVKAPKIYLRDSGLLHSLLGIVTNDDLQSNPIAGLSWEGWALEQVLAQVPSTWKPFFYRTAAGAEIDLILQKPGRGGPIAVEFKYSSGPKLTEGFWNGLKDVKASKGFVVAPVKEAYPLKENVMVLPIYNLSALHA